MSSKLLFIYARAKSNGAETTLMVVTQPFALIFIGHPFLTKQQIYIRHIFLPKYTGWMNKCLSSESNHFKGKQINSGKLLKSFDLWRQFGLGQNS